MQPLAPNCTVWAGRPASSMIAWQAPTRRPLRAIASSVGAGAHASASVAFGAAITSGLPL